MEIRVDSGTAIGRRATNSKASIQIIAFAGVSSQCRIRTFSASPPARDLPRRRRLPSR